MDPVRQLTDEHRVIERCVDVLEKIADGLEEFRPVPADLIMTSIGMMLECANEYHYAKEESILLPLLEKAGNADLIDTFQSLSGDYEASLEYIDAIIKSMETYKPGDMDEAVRMIGHIRPFLEHARPIFEKEEDVIHRQLKEKLGKEELAQLEEMLQDFDQSWNGPLLANYQKMVRELERKASQIVW